MYVLIGNNRLLLRLERAFGAAPPLVDGCVVEPVGDGCCGVVGVVGVVALEDPVEPVATPDGDGDE